MTTTFYSNGKLLITAEYGVLDGALALALPTKYGQSLEVKPYEDTIIQWNSLDEKGHIWFSGSYTVDTFDLIDGSDEPVAKTLEQLLKKVKALNPNLNAAHQGLELISKLTFPRNWGLGSSSTLINNLAEWGEVDAYTLLEQTFGGSGYDIACAQYNTPIHYRLEKGLPSVKKVSLQLPFTEQLYFVFLNKKQDSREAIANYRKQDFEQLELVNELTNLTAKLTKTKSLKEFESLITHHEKVLSRVLKIAPVKERLFSDYFGAIKSLGGWGGDFILATGNEKTPDYFKAKGFDVVIPYREMIL